MNAKDCFDKITDELYKALEDKKLIEPFERDDFAFFMYSVLSKNIDTVVTENKALREFISTHVDDALILTDPNPVIRNIKE